MSAGRRTGAEFAAASRDGDDVASPNPKQATAAAHGVYHTELSPWHLTRSASLSSITQSFICPITGQIFAEPVMTADGHCYERQAIQEWFWKRVGNDGNPLPPMSPATGGLLPSTELVKNRPMKAVIDLFIARRPDMRKHRYKPQQSISEKARLSVLPRAFSTLRRVWSRRWSGGGGSGGSDDAGSRENTGSGGAGAGTNSSNGIAPRRSSLRRVLSGGFGSFRRSSSSSSNQIHVGTDEGDEAEAEEVAAAVAAVQAAQEMEAAMASAPTAVAVDAAADDDGANAPAGASETRDTSVSGSSETGAQDSMGREARQESAAEEGAAGEPGLGDGANMGAGAAPAPAPASASASASLGSASGDGDGDGNGNGSGDGDGDTGVGDGGAKLRAPPPLITRISSRTVGPNGKQPSPNRAKKTLGSYFNFSFRKDRNSPPPQESGLKAAPSFHIAEIEEDQDDEGTDSEAADDDDDDDWGQDVSLMSEEELAHHQEQGADITPFICPLSGEIMDNPVVTPDDGCTYEAKLINAWLSDWGHSTDGKAKPTNPLTGANLKSERTMNNHALRNTIVDSLRKEPHLRREYATLATGDMDVDCVSTLQGHASTVSCSAVFRQGKQQMVLTGGLNEMRLWSIDMNPPRAHGKRQPREMGQCVRTAMQSSEGAALAGAHSRLGWVRSCHAMRDGAAAVVAHQLEGGVYQHVLKVWELSGSRQLNQVLGVLKGHAAPITCCRFIGRDAQRDDPGTTFFSGGGMFGGAKRQQRPPSPSNATDNSRFGGVRVLSGSEDKTLRVWDLSTGKLARTLKTKSKIAACYSSRDGRTALGATRDGKLQVWDVEAGKQRKAIEGAHEGAVTCCSMFAANPHVAVSGGADGKLCLWDLRRTGAVPVKVLEGHEGRVNDIQLFNASVLSASEDCTMRIWSLFTGEIIKTIDGHDKSITSCAVFGKRRFALSTSQDKTLKLWSVAS